MFCVGSVKAALGQLKPLRGVRLSAVDFAATLCGDRNVTGLPARTECDLHSTMARVIKRLDIITQCDTLPYGRIAELVAQQNRELHRCRQIMTIAIDHQR